LRILLCLFALSVAVQWLREEQVLSSASLEWGMWLMNFLMTEAPEIAATGALHHKCVGRASLLFRCH
jgi:hypothetical protein